MGGGGGILSPITELFFGKPKEPDPVIYTPPAVVQTVAPAAATPAAEDTAAIAVEKELKRKRTATGQLKTMVAGGTLGDTTTPDLKRPNLAGV